MQNAIFSSSSESFMVYHIVHAGPVFEIPQDKQKNNKTHYFRLTTTRGAAYCRFKSEDTARKSRGVLGAMLGSLKPCMFRWRNVCVDLASVVSIGRVVELRNGGENDKFGLPLALATIDEQCSQIWLTFTSEESGQNVRRAIWSNILTYYNPADAASESALPETIIDAEIPHVEETEIVYTAA